MKFVLPKIDIWTKPVQVDRQLIWLVLGLCAIGILAVYSASYDLAVANKLSQERYLVDHTIRIGLALVAMLVISQIDYHIIAKYSRFLIIAGLLSLLWLQIYGKVGAKGAARELGLFRPRGFALLALMIHTSVLLAKKQFYIQDFWHGFAPTIIWAVLFMGLAVSNGVSFTLMTLVIVLALGFVGRIPVKYLMGLIGVGLVAAALVMAISPKRQQRVDVFTSEMFGVSMFGNFNAEEIAARNYQPMQAEIAIANGGLMGVGMGKSTQKGYLPDPESDYIFAIISEEYGMLGALFVLGLVVLLMYRGFMKIAPNAPDPLGFFLAISLTLIVGMTALFHIMVNCRLMPVTGLSLPFVSWGGSELLLSGIIMGILLNISGKIKPNAESTL
jgi:cell division protein FtsW